MPSATARVTADTVRTRCGAWHSSVSPNASDCRSARSPTRWRRCRRSAHRRATTGTSCRGVGCRGSTSRSPRWSCCAIVSTAASGAGACRWRRASCTTPPIGRRGVVRALVTCSVIRSRPAPCTHHVDEVVVIEGLPRGSRCVGQTGFESFDGPAATFDVRVVRGEHAHLGSGLFDDPADVLGGIRGEAHLPSHVLARSQRECL